jgi:cysteine desulfurase / selenocysteine lyase
MPVAGRWAYLDHAAVGPLPAPTRAALVHWADDAAANGDAHWPDWNRGVESCRAEAARLLHADPEEIALVGNTAQGIGLVAEGYPWRQGDNVVTLADEFPSNQYPWMNLAGRGVETRRVPVEHGRVDFDRLAAAMDQRTRILAISWVSYLSGWRYDVDELARLAHDRGALLALDAIQGLGVFDLDVSRTPVDFVAAGGYKWMLGPEGVGLFYVRRQHLDLLRPLGVGWHSVVHAKDFTRIEFNLRPEAARYEGGSQNMPGMIGLGESLRLLNSYGPAALARRVVEITDLAGRRLAETGAVIATERQPGHQSGIVLFEMPGRSSDELANKCLARGVILRTRAGRLRISPHAYNNEEDIERLVAALSE